jgi:hypothetical protein
VNAADRPRIALLNTVVHGVVTVASAAVQGHVQSARDVISRFAAGSVSGVGMYGAKELAGRGHATTGWIVANAVGSISENAIAGRHPFAQLGYSIGPLRIRFSLPHLDPGSDALAHIDLSAFEALALAEAMVINDRAEVRAGMLTFTRGSPYERQTGLSSGLALGATAGIFPGVFLRNDVIWRHEAVHAIQGLQGDVLEPSFGFLSREAGRTGERRRLVRFESVKIGLVNFAMHAVLQHQAYEDGWVEIEAFRLSENTTPRGQ